MRKVDHRSNQILELLDKHGFLTIRTLAKRLESSEITIRRNIRKLAEENLIKRTKGGALSLQHTIDESSDYINQLKLSSPDELSITGTDVATVRERKLLDDEVLRSTGAKGHHKDLEIELSIKQRIAKHAASMIKDSSRVIFDTGSTVGEVINFIGDKQRLTIMTSSLNIAVQIAKLAHANRFKLLCTGGVYDIENDLFYGTNFADVLKDYSFDQLFIGADGCDLERGTMSVNETDNYSAILSSISNEVIVLIESSKIGRRMPKLELPWSQIHTVITDKFIKPKDLAIIRSKGIKVILV